MPVKPNKASLTKALFIVKLVVLSIMGMVTALRLPENAQVSDTLHVNHTPLALRQKRYLRSAADVTAVRLPEDAQVSDTLHVIHTLRQKRYLRSAADVTSSGRSSSAGVRRLALDLQRLTKLSARLDESVSAATRPVDSYIKVKAYKYRKRTSDYVFKDLKLDKMEIEPFDSPNFSTWIHFVRATTRTKNKAIAEMCRTLWHLLPEHYLVKAVGGVKASHKFGALAKLFREYRMRIHKNMGMTAEKAITFLGLNRVSADELIGSPEFTMWGALLTQTHMEYFDAYKYLVQRMDYPLLMRALAAIRADNENFIFGQGLIYHYLWKLHEFKEKPVEVYQQMKFEIILSSGTDDKNRIVAIVKSLLQEPLGRIWLDYAYMCSYKKGLISDTLVLNKLIDVFGIDDGKKLLESLMKEKDLEESTDRIILLVKMSI